MKNLITLFVLISMFTLQGLAKTKEDGAFTDEEANFKKVLETVLEKYVDKNVTKQSLYRAAAAGVLASLNKNDETSNKLLSPSEYKDMESDLSGKIIGIGAVLKFDEHTGYGLVLKPMAGSPAEKAGLKADDQILSVEGKKFKGLKLIDLVNAIRGPLHSSVALRILREDKILNLSVKRETVPWTPVELEFISPSTAVLSVGFFNEQTHLLVEQKLNEIRKNKIKNLILDIRDNDGGGLEQAVKVAGQFLPKGAVIAQTKDRDGHLETFLAEKEGLGKEVKIVLLTNKKTFCGAELFTAALKENRSIKSIGESTFGKWNAQKVETLPNHFAIKYTTKSLLSPQGHSYQNTGITPDLEVTLPEAADVRELRSRLDVASRINFDPQLKAAIELIKSSS